LGELLGRESFRRAERTFDPRRPTTDKSDRSFEATHLEPKVEVCNRRKWSLPILSIFQKGMLGLVRWCGDIQLCGSQIDAVLDLDYLRGVVAKTVKTSRQIHGRSLARVRQSSPTKKRFPFDGVKYRFDFR
jgi:hypothetical protein